MPSHPVTNYPLLEGNNYRTWSATMKRLLESQGLFNLVSAEAPESTLSAKTINLLSEHCVPELQDVFFTSSSPHQIWENLHAKFGPTNTMLGESAQAALSRQRWVKGDDPISQQVPVGFVQGHGFGAVHPQLPESS